MAICIAVKTSTTAHGKPRVPQLIRTLAFVHPLFQEASLPIKISLVVTLNIKVVAASSKSVLIRAGSRIVLDTPDLTISHKSSVVGLGSKNGRDERNRDGRDTDGGVGIWSNGSSLTGRAHHLVLFQAGRSSDGYGEN